MKKRLDSRLLTSLTTALLTQYTSEICDDCGSCPADGHGEYRRIRAYEEAQEHNEEYGDAVNYRVLEKVGHGLLLLTAF